MACRSVLIMLFLATGKAFRIKPNCLCRIATTSLAMVESNWSRVKILKNSKDAQGLKIIDIEVPEELSNLYRTPGQYVQIRLNSESKPSFYAIAR